MARCSSCERRKPQRSCPALGTGICSACCGVKRQRTIACPESCQYLQSGAAYQESRDINQTVTQLLASTFRSSDHDVFRKEEAASYAAEIEGRLLDEFYESGDIVDEDIFAALAQVYWHMTGRSKALTPTNRCEKVVFGAVAEADSKCPLPSEDLRAKTILRILRSIKNSTGGPLGPRGYLELIYSMFYTDGHWSAEFRSPLD